jgi:SsrA-binding protein
MIISRNKKSAFEYHILDEYVAGIVLFGSEVKSIANNKVSLNESYCYINNGEIFIKNMHISTCESANQYDMHDPIRVRKLLLNKKEITTLNKKVQEKGMTLVPINIHKTKTGLIKIKIGLAKGKKLYDKKETIKERDINIETNRQLKNI